MVSSNKFNISKTIPNKNYFDGLNVPHETPNIKTRTFITNIKSKKYTSNFNRNCTRNDFRCFDCRTEGNNLYNYSFFNKVFNKIDEGKNLICYCNIHSNRLLNKIYKKDKLKILLNHRKNKHKLFTMDIEWRIECRKTRRANKVELDNIPLEFTRPHLFDYFTKENKINKDNFHSQTVANFYHVSKLPLEIINNPPDFISESGSKYWYTDNGVYRFSDHWGEVSKCIWKLDIKYRVYKRGVFGYCNFKNFYKNDFCEWLIRRENNLGWIDAINLKISIYGYYQISDKLKNKYNIPTNIIKTNKIKRIFNYSDMDDVRLIKKLKPTIM